jgi:hypothetical protein
MPVCARKYDRAEALESVPIQLRKRLLPRIYKAALRR